MLEDLKELIKDEKIIEENPHGKTDEELQFYIVQRAKKKLNNQNGYVSDDEVKSWAIHFYQESKETIEKEVGKTQTQQPPKEQTKEKPKSKKKAPKEDKTQPNIFDFGV